MLAEALCKLEGFTYAPSDSIYWQHGHSTEQDFIYVTTANLTHDQLQELSDEVGPERSLLVLCTAFRARADRYPNLTVKKIPKQVLSRCEWGHDDYSLRVENLPQAQAVTEEQQEEKVLPVHHTQRGPPSRDNYPFSPGRKTDAYRSQSSRRHCFASG